MACQMGNTLISLAWVLLSSCPMTSKKDEVCTKIIIISSDKGQEITIVEKMMSLSLAGG